MVVDNLGHAVALVLVFDRCPCHGLILSTVGDGDVAVGDLPVGGELGADKGLVLDYDCGARGQ